MKSTIGGIRFCRTFAATVPLRAIAGMLYLKSGCMKSWLSLRANRAFLFFLGVLHIVGLCIAVHTGAITLRDSHEYLSAAQNIEHGVYYSGDLHQPWNPDFVSRRPPVYPLLLTAIQPWATVHGVLVVQMLISITTLVGISMLLQRWCGFTTSVNRVLAIGVLLSPVQIIYANFIMAEIVFQACVFWMFYAGAVYYYSRRWLALLVAAALLCIAMLTKPVVFLLWVPALLVSIFLAWRTRTWQVALCGVIPALTVVAWCWCNAAWTGYYHFSSMKKTNLVSYNTHALVSRLSGTAYADSVVDGIYAHAASITDYGQRMEYSEREATQWIYRGVRVYVVMHTQGMANMMLDPGRFDIYKFLDIHSSGSMSLLRVFSGQGGYSGIIQRFGELPIGIVLYLGIVFAANIGFSLSLLYFIWRGRCPIVLKVVVCGLIVYLVGITGHVGAARYRTAIVPLLLFTLALTADAWRAQRNKKRLTH